jgi:hypothetical protein
MVFGETNGEKVVCVVLAVLSWMVMAREMRKSKLNHAAFAIILGCWAVFLFVGYLALKVKGY